MTIHEAVLTNRISSDSVAGGQIFPSGMQTTAVNPEPVVRSVVIAGSSAVEGRGVVDPRPLWTELMAFREPHAAGRRWFVEPTETITLSHSDDDLLALRSSAQQIGAGSIRLPESLRELAEAAVRDAEINRGQDVSAWARRLARDVADLAD